MKYQKSIEPIEKFIEEWKDLTFKYFESKYQERLDLLNWLSDTHFENQMEIFKTAQVGDTLLFEGTVVRGLVATITCLYVLFVFIYQHVVCLYIILYMGQH